MECEERPHGHIRSNRPPAAEPLYLLINQHYQVSRSPARLRRWIVIRTIRCGAAVWWPSQPGAHATLVREQLYPPSPETLVPLSERMALELGALEGLLSNGTPIDAVAPRISNQAQRQHVLPAPLVSLLVQTTLVLVLSALADDARLIIVSTPRTAQGVC